MSGFETSASHLLWVFLYILVKNVLFMKNNQQLEVLCSDVALKSALWYEIDRFKTADEFSVPPNPSRVHVLPPNPESTILPPQSLLPRW